jgi:hypothetical protein
VKDEFKRLPKRRMEKIRSAGATLKPLDLPTPETFNEPARYEADPVAHCTRAKGYMKYNRYETWLRRVFLPSCHKGSDRKQKPFLAMPL